ncbi:S1C family serine protease [Steroidobacter cummioxidans]|uniref:S1C family serine protease n=1 Tax=Steroidobacter cummioxidans TaxID=1803913 RepID=UPI000E316A13|nr:trypsin-like peptidase domain-containing protein [Steroidobacter cummioxidans]
MQASGRSRWRNITRLIVLALAAYGAWYLGSDTVHRLTASAAPRPVVPRRELMADEQAVIGLFEAAKGSVVFISTQERVLDYWTRNVMTVPRGTGSGFIWDEQGHVVTNLHVIQGGSSAVVKLADGRDFEATFVGGSETHDIAVLKIAAAKDSPAPIPVGSSGDVQVGQKVFAIGNPFGLDWTLTTGIVSALDRALNEEDGRVIQHLIQTDAAINPGNSGGPLLDSAGRLIGMNTAIFSPSGASAGIGFAVPVDTINRVVPELIANGRYAPPSLGIDVDEVLSRAVARQFGVRGAAILRVRQGSTGDRAGLRGVRVERRNTIIPGDVIVAVNGKEVDSGALLSARLDDYKPGDTVRLKVWRDGKEIELNAQLQQGG